MYWREIRKIATVLGFLVALTVLGINLLGNKTLMTAGIRALLSFFTAAILFHYGLSHIGHILTSFLEEQKEKARLQEEEKQKIEQEKLRQQEEELKKEKAVALEKAKNALSGVNNGAN